MQLRFSFFLLLALLLAIGCNRDDEDFVTPTPGDLPPTVVLNSTTSLAGTVTNPDGTFPSNATAEVLYGDFVIASRSVNTGDGTWSFDGISVSDDPNVLVRISSPGWVPSIRSIPNRSDIVRYSNVVLLDRGQTTTISHSSAQTLTEGLLTVTIPGDSYANYNASVDLSLNLYQADDIETLGDAIAAPFVIDEGGSFSIMSEPSIYALVATGENGETLNFNTSNEAGIELSTINAGPTSLIYVLNQETGYWENIATPDGLLEVNKFGYIAVAQASNSVRLTGRIEQPDGTPIPGGFLYALVTDANGSQSFDVSSANGNGDYELLVPEGSSGTVFLNPQACGENRYTITQQNTDLDLGVFSVDVGSPTQIEGVVDGCTSGVPSTEDLALIVSSTSIGSVIIPVAADGSFDLTESVCAQEAVTFTPVIQSGPSEGRVGAQVTVDAGDPLTNLTFVYCDSVVSQELMYTSIGFNYIFTTEPSASQIHPDTIEIIGETERPVPGEMRWRYALGSQKVLATFSDADQTYTTDAYVDVDDFSFDGIELKFMFGSATGTRTDLGDGSTTSLESSGGVTVKVD